MYGVSLISDHLLSTMMLLDFFSHTTMSSIGKNSFKTTNMDQMKRKLSHWVLQSSVKNCVSFLMTLKSDKRQNMDME
jgi:hypothetical protein